MNAELQSDAVEKLYRAFASTPKPASIDACPCCHEPGDLCQLLQIPLRQVPTRPLASYAFSAFYTVGSEADFRYLLPRILELATSDNEWHADLEVVLKKLRLAQWDNWTSKERGAVAEFLMTSFEAALLDADEAGEAVDSWVCGLALAHVDLRHFQERLLRHDARKALRAFYDLNSQRLVIKGKLTNSFWADHPAEMQAVARWLKSPEVQARIEETYGSDV